MSEVEPLLNKPEAPTTAVVREVVGDRMRGERPRRNQFEVAAKKRFEQR